MPTLYKIRGFTPTDSAITLYTHKLWHRRYFLNREVPYWLQSSITGSAFRGVLLILQKNSMLTDTKIFRSRMGAFRCACATHARRQDGAMCTHGTSVKTLPHVTISLTMPVVSIVDDGIQR